MSSRVPIWLAGCCSSDGWGLEAGSEGAQPGLIVGCAMINMTNPMTPLPPRSLITCLRNQRFAVSYFIVPDEAELVKRDRMMSKVIKIGSRMYAVSKMPPSNLRIRWVANVFSDVCCRFVRWFAEENVPGVESIETPQGIVVPLTGRWQMGDTISCPPNPSTARNILI